MANVKKNMLFLNSTSKFIVVGALSCQRGKCRTRLNGCWDSSFSVCFFSWSYLPRLSGIIGSLDTRVWTTIWCSLLYFQVPSLPPCPERARSTTVTSSWYPNTLFPHPTCPLWSTVHLSYVYFDRFWSYTWSFGILACIRIFVAQNIICDHLWYGMRMAIIRQANWNQEW